MNQDRSIGTTLDPPTGGLAPGGDTGRASGPVSRDRALRRSLRLRQALVGGAVAACLGVAAVVGSGVPGTAAPVASSAAGSTAGTPAGDSRTSRGTASGVSLRPGSGSSHASSGGS